MGSLRCLDATAGTMAAPSQMALGAGAAGWGWLSQVLPTTRLCLPPVSSPKCLCLKYTWTSQMPMALRKGPC